VRVGQPGRLPWQTLPNKRAGFLDTWPTRLLAGRVTELLTDDDIATRLQGLADWTRTNADEPAITATYKLADFAAALTFVNAVGAEAEKRDHHPDIDIRWNTVTLVLSTHSEGGLTEADFDLATTISGLPR
jgi:4a-hydroxytetrahydrobiopterin dehydratase